MSNAPNRPWVPEPSKDTGPHDPLSDDMKLVLAAYRSVKPKFEVKGWASIAAKRGMSEATAKQRFGSLKNKYLDEKAEAAQSAPATAVSTTAASAATGSSVSAPSTGAPIADVPSVSATVGTATTAPVPLPARRDPRRAAQSGSKRTIPHENEDGQGDEDGDMPPPAPKRARRSADDSTTSGKKNESGNEEDGEDDEYPVPAHDRFIDPKAYVFPNLVRSSQPSNQ